MIGRFTGRFTGRVTGHVTDRFTGRFSSSVSTVPSLRSKRGGDPRPRHSATAAARRVASMVRDAPGDHRIYHASFDLCVPSLVSIHPAPPSRLQTYEYDKLASGCPGLGPCDGCFGER